MEHGVVRSEGVLQAFVGGLRNRPNVMHRVTYPTRFTGVAFITLVDFGSFRVKIKRPLYGTSPVADDSYVE